MRNMNSIVGSVLTSDNRPVNNVRVELRDGSTGAIVGTSYTGMGGSFEFRQLQQGAYDLVAFSGSSQVEQRVQVSSMSTSVDLRVPNTRAPNDGMGNRMVSVTQYRVPQTAREEFRKAEEAAAKSKGAEAMKHLDKALETCPAFADALALRAAFKLDGRDIPGAIEDAQKAIDSDGSYALAYTVMGSALNVESKFDEALRSLQRAQSLAPDTWQTYFEIGRAYAGKKDYQMSLQALDRAQSLAPPNYSLIQLLRANSLMGLGRNSEAVAQLQQYLAKNPNGNRVQDAKQMLAQAQAAMESARNQ
ncbi:MAG TPA: tetratricopeptide repeat protein [Candidatus Angelobacter sp.]|nr:tetratricopeptide repeat protein [Candidatus Angelobacter sp.]